jgi:hypothetical protein
VQQLIGLVQSNEPPTGDAVAGLLERFRTARDVLRGFNVRFRFVEEAFFREEVELREDCVGFRPFDFLVELRLEAFGMVAAGS